MVLRPASAVGFEPWGKSLWMEKDGLQVAVLRTELERHGEGAWAEQRWIEDHRALQRDRNT